MKLKKKINKTVTFEVIARVVVSNDIRTPGAPAIRDGKRDGHADNDFFPVSKVNCAKFYQDLCKISSRSECRATPETPASAIFVFLISKTNASMFTTTFQSYIAIG